MPRNHVLDAIAACWLAAVALPILSVDATAQAQRPEPSLALVLQPPLGLPPMPLPPGPPPSEAVFALGRHLFADPILSRDRTISCQSCHLPANGFASPEPRPTGVGGRRALLHAPALINRGYGRSMRWDGRTDSLEAFVVQPISDPNEMDLPLTEALDRLRHSDDYRQQFAAAFAPGDDHVTDAHLAQALSTFVRGIVAGDAPVDRFHHGQPDALSPQQRAGLWLFESKAGCWRCHPAPLFTDEGFHNTGIGAALGKPLPARSAHTGDDADRGRFKTPTLRGIGASAPYMHDGSVATLAEVVAYYARGGNPNDRLDQHLRPLQLDATEQEHLVAFLLTL